MLTRTSVLSVILILSPLLANAQNCVLPWPIAVNVFDSLRHCVGNVVNVDPTIVARRFGDDIYGIEVNVQQGIEKGRATFLYPTTDCSGQAYMEADANLPQFLWADLTGLLWTNGTPPPGGSITVHSTRQAPDGQCSAFNEPGPVLVGTATPIDDTLVNSLTPPLKVDPRR